MAKKGTRSFWDTFWMILGTSKISLNLGPIIGHFFFIIIMYNLSALFGIFLLTIRLSRLIKFLNVLLIIGSTN